VFIIVFKIGNGIRRTISISNTIKIMANIKNRKENGTRALFFGSNPHSNGDVFSRSLLERVLRIFARKNTKVTITVAVNIAKPGINITQKY
jgi:hypothetical protein